MKKKAARLELPNTPAEAGQVWTDTRFQGGSRKLVVNGVDGRYASCEVTETFLFAGKEVTRTYKERLPLSSVGEMSGHKLVTE